MPPPVFLFAPGAGASSTHLWMQRWAGHLRTLGPVELLDYPYMQAQRGRPDPLPVLIQAHRAALQEARAKHPGPVILIGKSMGGRVGCHVALVEKIHAVICLGYPLCGGGDRTKLRDQVLLALRTPILFVQGTRDSLCPLDLLENVRPRLQAPNQLKVVADGDHSLQVTKRWLKANGTTQETIERELIATIADFCNEAANPAPKLSD